MKFIKSEFETNVSDKSFIEEQRFEAIVASLSSSNNKSTSFLQLEFK